jgi:ATP-binding cassette subfamily G (WHITE) protein 2 (PDR)
MLGNFTGVGTNAPPDAMRRLDVTNVNHGNQRVGSDSDASTIATNADGTNSHTHSSHSKEITPNHTSNANDVDDIPRREEEVHELARRITSQSQYSTTGKNPFHHEAGSALDPNGEHFNARAWCKAMLHMQSEDEQAAPPRRTGIAFRNLNVHGFGNATDYQKSVGNSILEGVGLVKRLIGQSKPTKINILRNLDGLVESGEMLVVLGPPGSGCSTFLKTVTGETHGFVVDGASQINYQGTDPPFCSKILQLTFP